MLTIDLDKINIQDGQVILDLGCGKGRHIHKLYYFKKCHVIGLDLSFNDLQVTYKGFEKYPDITGDSKRQFNLMVGDAHKLPFPDETFDRIICSEVLEHIPDYENIIKEIFRVSKKDSEIGKELSKKIPCAGFPTPGVINGKTLAVIDQNVYGHLDQANYENWLK